MLTSYTPSKVHELANRFEAMVRTLRIIQGRMLSGQDIPEVSWNDQTFLSRLAEVEQYFESMATKYERESIKSRREKEKKAENRQAGKAKAKADREKENRKKSSA